METRRNILTILGLAAASTPAMSIESLDTLHLSNTPRSVPGLMQGMGHTGAQERIAKALENIAAALRSGEMSADKIEVISTAEVDNWMRHEVRIHCEIGLPA